MGGLVGDIFILSFCHAPECLHLLDENLRTLHVAHAMVFEAAAQGYPLLTQLWWAGGLALLGPIGLWQLGRWLLVDCHSQGTTQTIH